VLHLPRPPSCRLITSIRPWLCQRKGDAFVSLRVSCARRRCVCRSSSPNDRDAVVVLWAGRSVRLGEKQQQQRTRYHACALSFPSRFVAPKWPTATSMASRAGDARPTTAEGSTHIVCGLWRRRALVSPRRPTLQLPLNGKLLLEGL
jgi:hypothetical protein